MLDSLLRPELSVLYVVQAAMTVWMLIDINRRGVEPFWFYVVLFLQPVGPWIYFFVHKISDFRMKGWLAGLFKRRPSLEMLRFRAEQTPTPAACLEYAERLAELKRHGEAVPHLEMVLKREPEHLGSLYLLAECHARAGRWTDAAALLKRHVAAQPRWRDWLAWRLLIEAHQGAGGHAEAVAVAAKLAGIEPSLEHAVLLARCQEKGGQREEARKGLERALEEYRFSPAPTRHDRRWAGKAQRVLKELS
ncbi:MAG: tetratricopeptide repeat protein [Gemmataceae bacterium]|nr:tetratricopeptide repeat protein [Gemmataceae bacterium]